jgi:hypothetical protein
MISNDDFSKKYINGNPDFFHFLKNDPHILLLPRDKKIESISIFFNKEVKQYLAFKMYQDEIVGQVSENFNSIKKYVIENCDAGYNGKNMMFLYPCTWSRDKKKKLFKEICKPYGRQNLGKLLLFLI